MPKGLEAKVKAHNDKSKHKVTLSMLRQVYNRGVGAYRTNPGSVRSNVKSPEQWAMARVNSFLQIVSGSKSANHDKDLLPASHASSTRKMDTFDPDELPTEDEINSRHSCDTATDKTSARYWSCRMWEKGTSVGQMTKDIGGQILKSDEEQRLVYGWASVITEKGQPVVDRQGDVIKPDTLVKAVNNFMEHVRVGKQMHDGDQVGVVVHSWPCTKEINKSVGIDADREGWLVAFKVYDDDVWAKVKSGELAAFSIGGRAVKGEYDGD